MRGWVYIATMTNTIGVVKIGYSERDPDLRVQEWARDTGAVGEAKVEYAVWVNEPREYETRVHKLLVDRRQKGSEWFKCEIQTAIEAILKSGTPLIQNFRTKEEMFEVAKTHQSEIDGLREKLANSESISKSRYHQLNEYAKEFDRKLLEKTRNYKNRIISLERENTEVKSRGYLKTLQEDVDLLRKENATLKSQTIPTREDISADEQSKVVLVSCQACSLKSIHASCPICFTKHRLPAFERASRAVRCRRCSRAFDVDWKGDRVSTRARREPDSP